MKSFACGDVVPGCGRTFAGESVDDILAQVAVHARESHDMSEVPDSVAAEVVANIR